MKIRRIFLTGGGGMVGRNLLDHPAAKLFEFFAPQRSELNLKDYNSLEAYISETRPDMIIHAAGRVGGIQANISEPLTFFIDNLDIGRNVIQAARKNGVKRLINLGSSCMYPHNGKNPLRESDILQGELEPTNEGYALAKIAIAKMCEYINREDALYHYKTLIPCNLFGLYDKFDPTQSHLIPAIIHKIHKAKMLHMPSVEIWGDGLARREFMFAGDFADCLMRAVINFDDMPQLMNIGMGRDFSILEYYKIIAEIIEYKGEFYHDLSKPVGMRQKLVDIQQQLDWGWKASVEIHEGIKQTYEYYLKGQ